VNAKIDLVGRLNARWLSMRRKSPSEESLTERIETIRDAQQAIIYPPAPLIGMFDIDLAQTLGRYLSTNCGISANISSAI
jgi:hypothetical protein